MWGAFADVVAGLIPVAAFGDTGEKPNIPQAVNGWSLTASS
jgi:hypothetical protein